MKNDSDSRRNPPRCFGAVFSWSSRALDLWKAGGRLLIPAASWPEFFEKQAKNAEASMRESSDDYELEEYWRFQAHDFRVMAAWLRENVGRLPTLPKRVSL